MKHDVEIVMKRDRLAKWLIRYSSWHGFGPADSKRRRIIPFLSVIPAGVLLAFLPNWLAFVVGVFLIVTILFFVMPIRMGPWN